MNIQTFMHRPTFVEAVLVNRDNMAEVAQWCGGFLTEGQKFLKGPISQCVKVEVLRPHHPRQTMAFYGDWVLKTESGWKVYTSKAFYEKFIKAHNITSDEGSRVMSTEKPISITMNQ